MANYRGPFRHIVAIRCLAQAHGLASPILPDPLAGGDFEEFYPAAHLGESPRGWRPEPKLNGGANTSIVAGNLPGRYSGEMRRVVQDLLGRGASIPWSYSAATTHGIYASNDENKQLRVAEAVYTIGDEVVPSRWDHGWVYVADTTGTTGATANEDIVWPTTAGATVVDGDVTWEALRPYTPRWLIQIASTGVHAYPIPIGGANTDAERILDYRPLSTPFPALADPDVVELADSAAVSAWFSNTALFTACGWAFSASGALASNTSTYTDGSSWLHGVLHTLTITASVDGSAPASAALSEIDDDVLWGDTENHVKIPDYAAGTLVSVPWTYRPDAYPNPSVAPVYCWYAGEILQRVDYHYSQNTHVDESEPNPGWPYASSPWSVTNTYGAQRVFTSPAISDAPTEEHKSGTWRRWGPFDSLLGHRIDPQGSNFFRYVEYWLRYRDTTTNANEEVRALDTVVLPLGDREAAYHTRRNVHTETANVSTRAYATIRRRSHSWAGGAGFTRCRAIHPDPNVVAGTQATMITPCLEGDYERRPLIGLSEIHLGTPGRGTAFEAASAITPTGFRYTRNNDTPCDYVTPSIDTLFETWADEVYAGDPGYKGYSRASGSDVTCNVLGTPLGYQPDPLLQTWTIYIWWDDGAGGQEEIIPAGFAELTVGKYWLDDYQTTNIPALDPADSAISNDYGSYEGGLARGNTVLGITVDASTWPEWSKDLAGAPQTAVVIPDSSAAEKTIYSEDVWPSAVALAAADTYAAASGTDYPPDSLQNYVHSSFVGKP